MFFIYPAIFHAEDGAYWVEFPDLIGCQTYGDTIAETMRNAQEALNAYILTILEENQELPSASDISAIAAEDNSFTSLVACEIDLYKDTKAVKKTLSIPAWLNDRATAAGINFSQTLQEGLLKKLQTR